MAIQLMDYIWNRICPGVALEAMVRERTAAQEDSITMMQPALPDLESVLALSGMKEIRGAWLDGWEASMRAFDADSLDILEPSVLGERCGWLGMPDDVRTALRDGLQMFDRHPGLKSLLWHCVHTFFHGPAWPEINSRTWPDLPSELDPSAGLFYVYVYLAGLPLILDYHKSMRIPLEISLDTLSDMELWIEDYFHKHGCWGFDEQGWLGGHFSGRIYKLGRLQFEMSRYEHDYLALRNNDDGRVVVLAGDGLGIRPDGLLDGSDGYNDPDAWSARLSLSDASVTGYPVDRGGWVSRDPVTLDLTVWREILGKGDPILAVHIPATGPMKPEKYRPSFARAIPFFNEHFSEHKIHAFTCSTWLLDPQLEQVLGRKTNIIRFLREWYLTPEPGADDAQTIERVFGLVGPDAVTWPNGTTLQKAMLRFIEGGGRWRMGAGLIFPEA